jgi:Asp-tRNA(Asn)/Glu-tRNA(Gln) amidotransferase A subunit family amidase
MNGLGARGLPTGLEFMARAGREGTLLELAGIYQSTTDWHQRYPSL